jgi:hypothetical protein
MDEFSEVDFYMKGDINTIVNSNKK